jgi:uroporphyrinogen decarboxylase
MNKRDVMLRLLDPVGQPPYVPAAFFLHFGPDYREGQAAVDRHIAYFRATGMDFVKVQYEHAFPHRPEIQHPRDWQHMPSYGRDFFEPPLAVVKGLVNAMKDEALVLVTLYSPFMSAGHVTSDETITAHLKEDPELVRPGLEAMTESLLTFVRGCIDLGVDGFYASTQGGEAHRFSDPGIFASYIKPYDLALMEEINNACPFNILHICDYCGGYDDLTPFVDYPGDVVNASLRVGGQVLTPLDAAQFFARPFMGGMDRHGAIASGDRARIMDEVEGILPHAPERFILGADCTVPGTTDWRDLRAAIDAAHAWPRET